MINAKRANAFIWTINVLLIAGIFVITIQLFLFPKPRTRGVKPVEPLPIENLLVERLDASALTSPSNPLLPPEIRPPSPGVLLIGIDRIKDDSAATAYLYLVGRRIYVNAYAGEVIRDATTGREVSELSGWRLKSITSKGAVFSTPQGEKTLPLAPGPDSLVAAAWHPPEERTGLDVAVELYKDGRLDDACVVFEESFRRQWSNDAVYAFMVRAGEEVIASMMNSRDERIRTIGYRIFELAKPSGDRVRTSNA
ncbi:MAG TPA: hypothetical protein VFC86_06295 [Planctomycetota bacterium]|nr:hypothetical protein [Planctomycetota bacterium]